mgnify:FL=1
MRRIWNRPAYPVWSLATLDAEGQGNMNICTYVTPVSLQPKLMLVSLYHHTRTLANVQATGRGVLQLLTVEQRSAVRTCGRQSGNDIDKLARLEANHPIDFHQEMPYFKACAGFMELSFIDFVEVGADHLLGVGRVAESRNLSDAEIMTTEYLKAHGIIR